MSFLLFCGALVLTVYSDHHPWVARLGSGIVSEILRPVQAFNRFVQESVYGVWEGYFALVGVRKENDTLAERLKVLEAENSRLLEFENENKRLQSLLKMSAATGLDGVVANVIAFDPSNWVQAVTIDKGASAGIRNGMAVLEGNGVVGQVISVGLRSSKVLMMTDHSSGIDAIVQDSRIRGVVQGAQQFKLLWKYVLTEEEVKVGDRAITSGMDGVFPKGLLVGIVARVDERKGGKLFRRIEIKPAVDFSRLEIVSVVTNYP